MAYTPTPIDTNSTSLPDNISVLVEKLAEHIHDSWAQQRIAKGWSYGPTRSDAEKEHQCLVPYQDLSESEKEYDRITVKATLSAIVSLGYRVEPVDQNTKS